MISENLEPDFEAGSSRQSAMDRVNDLVSSSRQLRRPLAPSVISENSNLLKLC